MTGLPPARKLGAFSPRLPCAPRARAARRKPPPIGNALRPTGWREAWRAYHDSCDEGLYNRLL